jgi:hypothetical protein
MKKGNNKLIDKVISSLDWDAIYEVNKCFKHGVGDGTSAIPGVKRKPFADGITKNDIKNELKSLLKYVIENDLAEVIYGYWMIFWNNAEWSEESINQLRDQYDEDEEDDEDFDAIILDSTLEVIYSPQRICAIENTQLKDIKREDSDMSNLESMLKKALSREQYELASKIRDVIKLQNSSEQSDT